MKQLKHAEDADQFWTVARDQFRELSKAEPEYAKREKDPRFRAWYETLKPLFQIGFELGWASADLEHENMQTGAETMLDRLMTVIREVHAAHADDVCWLDVDKIFLAAGLPVPDRRVGCKEAMLKNCARFIDTMCADGKWRTYVELEAEIVELKAENERLKASTNQ